jgi:hypothetical protein
LYTRCGAQQILGSIHKLIQQRRKFILFFYCYISPPPNCHRKYKKEDEEKKKKRRKEERKEGEEKNAKFSVIYRRNLCCEFCWSGPDPGPCSARS